ncbi:glycoside hydrolase family 5 protein [Athelia psychrophila]|uniref:Glycoside hydrolase family 5 protein n=1 Tax=Athelia psychrophila TaxID=1759441 RepID=A0A166L8D2_9AGAM|nr:glycoside hydrolase family 5 protein [Fibularhizoctonia sp. CBS 109695]
MRNITGVGAGKGPYMSGTMGSKEWPPVRDSCLGHTESSSNPIPTPHSTALPKQPSWHKPLERRRHLTQDSVHYGFNASRSSFGVAITGEMSVGFKDCGLFLRGVNVPPTTTNCGAWQDSSKWSAATKAGVMQFTLASMDALQDYFFWTWKIGNSTAGIVESPLWSYQLGLQEGWIPTDPRTAVGKCAAVGVSGAAFDGTYLPWQTGGAGAGTISATWSSSYGVYPPATISNAGAAASALPQYTSTGTVATLVPPPTLTASATASAVSAGNGWFDASDTAGGVTAIAGCTYPDAWSAVSTAVPTSCGAKTDAALAALATPLPRARRELDYLGGGGGVDWSIQMPIRIASEWTGGATRNNLKAQADWHYLFWDGFTHHFISHC